MNRYIFDTVSASPWTNDCYVNVFQSGKRWVLAGLAGNPNDFRAKCEAYLLNETTAESRVGECCVDFNGKILAWHPSTALSPEDRDEVQRVLFENQDRIRGLNLIKRKIQDRVRERRQRGLPRREHAAA